VVEKLEDAEEELMVHTYNSLMDIIHCDDVSAEFRKTALSYIQSGAFKVCIYNLM
jgi:hypothetical protein